MRMAYSMPVGCVCLLANTRPTTFRLKRSARLLNFAPTRRSQKGRLTALLIFHLYVHLRALLADTAEQDLLKSFLHPSRKVQRKGLLLRLVSKIMKPTLILWKAPWQDVSILRVESLAAPLEVCHPDCKTAPLPHLVRFRHSMLSGTGRHAYPPLLQPLDVFI